MLGGAGRLGGVAYLLSAGFLVLMVAVAILGPVLTPEDPTKPQLLKRMEAPALVSEDGARLGRDQLGRDLLSRLIVGSRVTLIVGFSAVLLGGVVGVALGVVSGYFGGWTDRIIMRLVDMQLAFPLMLLALSVVAVLGPSLINLVYVLALTSWIRYARIVRGEVLSLREREFVQAAKVSGAKAWRIMFVHILPNVVTPATVVGTLELARVIILESALSFLGLGVQPPDPSWGRMLADGRSYMASAWWLTAMPGIAIVLTVLSINLIGDWLRDRFDPKLNTG